jgi:hypothetical protein
MTTPSTSEASPVGSGQCRCQRTFVWKPFGGISGPARSLPVLVGEPGRAGSCMSCASRCPRGVKLMPHRHPEDRHLHRDVGRLLHRPGRALRCRIDAGISRPASVTRRFSPATRRTSTSRKFPASDVTPGHRDPDRSASQYVRGKPSTPRTRPTPIVQIGFRAGRFDRMLSEPLQENALLD